MTIAIALATALWSVTATWILMHRVITLQFCDHRKATVAAVSEKRFKGGKTLQVRYSFQCFGQQRGVIYILHFLKIN